MLAFSIFSCLSCLFLACWCCSCCLCQSLCWLLSLTCVTLCWSWGLCILIGSCYDVVHHFACANDLEGADNGNETLYRLIALLYGVGYWLESSRHLCYFMSKGYSYHEEVWKIIFLIVYCIKCSYCDETLLCLCCQDCYSLLCLF